jgi:hypothetical protein
MDMYTEEKNNSDVVKKLKEFSSNIFFPAKAHSTPKKERGN